MSNLIVFCQSFPYIFVGFNVRVECESLVKIYEEKWSSRLAHEWTTRERLHEKHMLESKQSFARLYFGRHFTTLPTREWLAKLSAWMILKSVFLISLHIHMSIHYPRTCKETFREKILAIHLRVRDCKPTIIYIISLSFPPLLSL